MKNDIPSAFANYNYKVKDEELPLIVLLISFISYNGVYDYLVSSKS